MSMMDSLSGIGEGVKNFSPDNLFSVFNSPVLAKIGFFLKTFAYFAVFIFGAILVWKFLLQYKIKITLLSRLGSGGIEVKYDKAKIVIDSQNKKKLQLFKTRRGKHPVTLPIPEAFYKGKMKKADHFFLWIDDNFQMHPIESLEGDKRKLGLVGFAKKFFKPDPVRDCNKYTDLLPPDDSDMFKVIENPLVATKMERLFAVRPQERDAWARQEDKIITEKYKKRDMMEKYLPAGILLMSMIIAFLIFFFGFKTLAASMGELTSSFYEVARACIAMGG